VIATDAELGKRAGHDMEEGVYTLPVLLTLAQGDDAADQLRGLLGGPLAGPERETALRLVRAGTGVKNAIETAWDYVALAEAECAKLPETAATEALRSAPRVLLESVIR
jgi:heptaprenyl diphosphate synthase